MSERNKALLDVQKAIRINTANIKAATVNATMCEVNTKTYQKRLIELERLHKIKTNNVQKAVDRYIDNLKSMHNTLDDLLAEKEALHEQLKEAIHHGEVLCEWCLRYFSPQGLSRHRNTCISKPENKTVIEHKAEIIEVKEDIESKKAALLKELERLGKKSAKKE